MKPKSFIDLDQFAVNVDFLFKYSSTWREDYINVESITEIVVQYLFKTFSDFKKLKIKFENIKEHFLKIVPLQTNPKRETEHTKRYKRMRR